MATIAENSESWHQLQSDFLSAWPCSRWRDVGIVVGCSGGADSVALLRLLVGARLAAGAETSQGFQEPRGFVVAAHFNHRLRGRESEGDQQFVRSLAQQWKIGFKTESAAETCRDEAGMRTARLEFLKSTAEQTGARYVALAHSADDQAETILHHLMRGTGPRGLAGIRPHRPLGRDLVLIRPLLEVRRGAIRQALESVGQNWREDSTNATIVYRRNWIRHQLLPLIESQYPQAGEAIARAGQLQREWCESIESQADRWFETHQLTPASSAEGRVILRCDRQADRAVIIAACQRLWSLRNWPVGAMSQIHWTQLADAIAARDTTAVTLPGGIQLRTEAGNVELTSPLGSSD